MNPIRLFHLADLHLGFGHTNLVFGAEEAEAQPAGRYVREVDIEKAVKWVVTQVAEAEPPVDVVLIAGDLFHQNRPSPRAITSAARLVKALVEQGTEVVIVDGNHELSPTIHMGSPTTFLRELGAHVINISTPEIIAGTRWRNPRLQGQLAVHALSYRAVAEQSYVGVAPLPDQLNVLLTHGRVQNVMPELNSLGRPAAAIPTSLLGRGWHYVALGDWHMHRFQPLKDIPAYYAGSLEALNFGEAPAYPLRPDDPYLMRGILDVRLSPNQAAQVTTLENMGRRPVWRLRTIEAADLTGEAVMKQLRSRLSAEELSSEALVRLDINSCAEEIRSHLDYVEIERLRQRFRRCELQWQFIRPTVEQSSTAPSQARLEEQWETFLTQQESDSTEQEWYLTEGRNRIQDARTHLRSQTDGAEE